MSEETPASAASEAPEGEAEARRPNVRKRPKHRGAGLKYLRSRYKRPPRPEEVALRRAILLVLGAGVPLPLLFLGGLVLDGTIALPGGKAAPAVHASPAPAAGHGEGHPADGAGRTRPRVAHAARGHGEHGEPSSPHEGHPTPPRPSRHPALVGDGAGGEAAEPSRHNLLGAAAGTRGGPASPGPSRKPGEGPLTAFWNRLVGFFGGGASPSPSPSPLAAAVPAGHGHATAHGEPKPASGGHGAPHASESPPAEHGRATDEDPGQEGGERRVPSAEPAHAAKSAGTHGEPAAPAPGHEEGHGTAGGGPVTASPGHGEAPLSDLHERQAAAPLEEAAPAPAPAAAPEEVPASPRPRPRPRPTSPSPTLTARAVAAIAGAWFSATATPPAATSASDEPQPRRQAAPDPSRLTRQAGQVSSRLGVRLSPIGPGAYGHRSADAMATVRLEEMPDGGSQLRLVTDLSFLATDREVRGHLPAEARRQAGGELAAFVERFPREGVAFWLRKRPSFGLVERFVATYMPPGSGTSTSARFDWWASMLRGRIEAATRPVGEEGEDAWTPTFNVGPRIGQAFLAGSEFTLQLYIPPEDPGL